MSSEASTSKQHDDGLRPDGSAADPRIHYASRGSSYFDVILALFCAVLIISNICATKSLEFGSWHYSIGPIQVSPIIADGGAFLFPLAYILGDVISEVYGFRAARRAIFTGFGIAILAALTFLVVDHVPGASFYEGQAGFHAVLGFVPRIVLASVCGYVVGQLLNSYVLVRMKAKSSEPKLWRRLAGSTGVGEMADTAIFCAIAASAIGIDHFSQYLNYFIVGYVFKCAVELLVMPVTMLVIKWLKNRESTYWV